MSKISENIKNLRLSNNMTQEKLAEKLSVTRQTVSCWENGKSEPDLDTIFKISDIFNTDITLLLNSEDAATVKTPTKNKINFYIIIPVFLAFILIASIFFLCKASDRHSVSSLKKYDPALPKNELILPELSGSLTIDTFYDYEQISKYAEEFTALYPKVKIIVNNINTYGNFDSYKKWIDTSLKNNCCADIIDMAQISSEKYSKQGLLCNFYNFIAEDSSFNEDDYYMNVLKANEYCGGLYSLPFYFYYDVAFISKPLLNEAGIKPPQKIDYKKTIEIYNKVIEYTDYTPKIAPGILKSSFWEKEFPLYYSFENGKADFNNLEFIEYLEKTKNIESTYNPQNGNTFWDKTRIVHTDEFMKEEYVFCEEDITAWDVLYFITEWENLYSPIPIVNSKGDFHFYTYQAEYAVTENCQNKELAWEFIKYCISEKPIPEKCNNENVKKYVLGNFHSRIPINVKNFYNSFHFQIKYDLEHEKNIINEIEKNDIKINSTSGKISDTIEQIHCWNKMINARSARQEFGDIIGNKMDEFYYTNLSAEEFSLYLQKTFENYFL